MDPWRLALGTLTAIPVRAPATVNRRTAGRAILLAPLATAPLGLLVAAILWLGGRAAIPPLAVALLAVGALALGTRALHWDGLSDTADGLTASYDAERSLQVMKSGTAGPAGVVATVVVLGVQAAALTGYVGTLPQAALAGGLVCLARCALWIVCCSVVPAARPDGLGVAFVGTVPIVLAVLGVALLTVVAGLVVILLVQRAVARFGGVTGDVFGAAIEIALAVLLLTWSWV